MIFQGIEVCCPFCRAELLQQNEETLNCMSCGRSFPVIFGIPDLRVFPDPYIDFEADRAKAMHLASHFDELNFEEMVRFYYLTTAVVPQHHAKQFTRGLLAAEARAEACVQDWEKSPGFTHRIDAFLEVGCGTAPLLIAAAKRFRVVTGVDIALRWLVVAKKRLQQAGLTVPLICACAEALPFPEVHFGTAAFDSTLEVVDNQKRALMEVARVLKPDGQIFIATPNRYSLGPDPHVQLWAGGYLPERWIASYARRQKAIPPKRNLLSARSLKRLLLESGFESCRLSVPRIGEEQSKHLPAILQKIVSLYNISRNGVAAGPIFRAIGPLLQAVARKPSVQRQ